MSSSATQAEIKARYLRLIRRYHPDRNRSPLAHVRTAEINEAFHFLSDPDLRAWHDAQLAVQRQDVATARARLNARALVVRSRRRPLLHRYGARIALAALLVGTGIAGWQIEHRMLGGGDPAGAQPGDDIDDSGAHHAIKALEAASAQAALDMPPVARDVVTRGVEAYHRVANSGDPTQARTFSEHCQAQAADADGWDALDFCVAFDQAAFVGFSRSAAPALQNDGYFVDRHDRAAHLYVSRLSSLSAIDQRLNQIRGQVESQLGTPRAGTARVLHGISKRGWMLAGAAWHVFGGADPKAATARARAQDF